MQINQLFAINDNYLRKHNKPRYHMQFQAPLIKAKLLKRYKRFLADAELADTGEVITAHCANPGAMTGLKEPDSTIWLSKSNNPKRKLTYSWELIEVIEGKQNTLVGINTSHPNKLVEEAINDGIISELQGYERSKREVKYGKNSRIDILLETASEEKCYVEVKNVHLLRKKGKAEFPDSVTARGTKHLNELSDMVREGHRAVLVFLIQRSDTKEMSIADDIDPDYAQAIVKARETGVEIIAYSCKISTKDIQVDKAVPFTF